MNPDLSSGPRRRSLPADLFARLQGALRWRGEGGGGVALGSWLGLALALALLTWLLAPIEPVLQLAPPFLAAAALWPSWQALAARSDVRRWAARLEWPLLGALLVAIAYHIFYPQLVDAGKPIDSADHQMLLFRVRLIGDALAHGRWDRWTHLLQGGDSITDLYPFLFDLLVTIVYKALPFSLNATYTGIVVALLIGRALAVHALCRRFAGPFLSGALAVAALADSGVDIWDGGTHGAVFWGLMHAQLSLTLCLVALRLCCDLLDEVSGPRLVGCAIVTALAAMAHPIGLFVMGAWLLALALAAAFRATELRRPGWTLAALALGLGVSAFLVLPAVRGLGQHGFSAAYPGMDYQTAGGLLVRGVQPSSGFGFAIGLGLIAVGAAATGSQVFLLAAAIASLLFFAYLLAPLSVQTRLFDFMPSLADGQPRRNTALIKLMALPAIAWLLALAFAHVQRVGSLRPRAVLVRGVVLALLLLGPGRALWVGSDEQAHGINRAFDRPPEYLLGTRIAPDEKAVFDWLAAERKQDPSPTLWRVAVAWPRRWRHTLWATGLRTGVPVVDFGWVSGNFLAYRPRELTPEGMRDWSIKYVLTEQPGAPIPGATQVFQSGGIWVWQVPSYDGLSVVAPPGVRIDGLRFEPDGIRFQVAGAPAGGADLRIRTAWFPAWRAWQDGAQLPVTARLPRPEAKPRQEQLALKTGNGEVVLTCDGTMPGAGFGGFASLVALGGLVLAATARRRRQIEAVIRRGLDWAAPRRQRFGAWWRGLPRRRRLALAAAPVLLLAAVGLIGRWLGFSRLRPSPWELSGLTATASHGGVSVRCRHSYWLGRSHCGQIADIDFYVGAGAKQDDTGEYVDLFPGLRLTVKQPGAEIKLTWDRVRLAGRALSVQYSVSGSFNVQWTAGGRTLYEAAWSGSGRQRFLVPAGAPRAGPVVLRAGSFGQGVSLVVDPKMLPAGEATR